MSVAQRRASPLKMPGRDTNREPTLRQAGALTNDLRYIPNLIIPNFKIKIYSPPPSLTSMTSEKSCSGEIRSISTHGMVVVTMIESEKRNATEQENWRQDAANRIMMTANFMSAFLA
jgi:hypothetical protein